MNNYSRKTDPALQLMDVMNRNLERSHPSIQFKINEIRPVISCSICKSTDHTVKSHHKKVVGGGVRGEYDSLVNDIIL